MWAGWRVSRWSGAWPRSELVDRCHGDSLRPRRWQTGLTRSDAAQEGALAWARAWLKGSLSPADLAVHRDGGVVISGLLAQRRPVLGAVEPAGPGWTAPEITRGAPRSAASEAWSVGAMAYWLVVGHRPMLGSDYSATLRAALRGVRSRRRIAAHIGQLLLAEPHERQTSRSEWADELRVLVSGDLQRCRWPIALAAAGLTASGLVAIALATSGPNRPECFEKVPVVQWAPLDANVRQLVRKSGLCQRGGSMLGDMRGKLVNPGAHRRVVDLRLAGSPPLDTHRRSLDMLGRRGELGPVRGANIRPRRVPSWPGS